MLRVLGVVISIGLADSLNPSTIAPGLYLASGDRPLRAVTQFTLGLAGVFILAGAFIAAGPGQAILDLVPHPSPTTRYVLETVAGAAMLVAAALLWRRRARLSEKALPEPPARGRSSAVLGASIGVVELPTAFPYFAAIVAIVGSGSSLTGQIVLIVIYNACFVLPLLLIVVTLALAPGKAQRLLTRARRFLERRWPVLVAGLALLAGVFVIVLGITGLGSGQKGAVGQISRRVRKAITR